MAVITLKQKEQKRSNDEAGQCGIRIGKEKKRGLRSVLRRFTVSLFRSVRKTISCVFFSAYQWMNISPLSARTSWIWPNPRNNDDCCCEWSRRECRFLLCTKPSAVRRRKEVDRSSSSLPFCGHGLPNDQCPHWSDANRDHSSTSAQQLF